MDKPKTPDIDPTVVATSAMVAFGPAACRNWVGVASECARFAADRMQQDINAQRAFLACRTPMDVVQQQISYSQAVSQLYANQTTRMVHLMTEAVQDTASQATQGHARKYDDIPL